MHFSKLKLLPFIEHYYKPVNWTYTYAFKIPVFQTWEIVSDDYCKEYDEDEQIVKYLVRAFSVLVNRR